MIPMYVNTVPPQLVRPAPYSVKPALHFVMPGEGRAATSFRSSTKIVDRQDKPGHDGLGNSHDGAFRAAAFIDSLGINTHIDFQAYGYESITTVVRALRYLGLRNVRDSAQNAKDAQLWPPVARATGVKFDDYIPETSPAGMKAALNLIPQLAREGVLNFIEGGNEEDDSYPVSLGNSQHIAAQFQKQVWALGQALGLPVINISFGAGWTARNNWQGNYGTVGDLSASTSYGNAHVYPVSGQTPDYAITKLNALAKLAATIRPVIITEIGWDTKTVDRVSAAKYTLDAAVDGLKNGNPKTYFYALFDDSSGKFGLMNADGTPRPAGTALHNLISLMTDTGPNATSFSTGSLGYTLSRTQVGDNGLLFEKSDGSYWLIAWNEQQPPGRQHDVTVGLDQNAIVTRFDPLVGTAATDAWRGDGNGVRAVKIAVSDHPTLIEIMPKTPPPGPLPRGEGE